MTEPTTTGQISEVEMALPLRSQVNMLRGGALQVSDLGGTGAIEGVGLQDVSAGLQELGVDVGDDVRAGDDQQVVVAPQLMRVLLVAITPEVLLSQPKAAAHEVVPYAGPKQKSGGKGLQVCTPG